MWCLLFVDVDGSCYLVDEILSLSELNLGYVDAVCGSILEGQLLMSTFSILDIWRFGGMLTSALPWETRSAKIHFFLEHARPQCDMKLEIAPVCCSSGITSGAYLIPFRPSQKTPFGMISNPNDVDRVTTSVLPDLVSFLLKYKKDAFGCRLQRNRDNGICYIAELYTSFDSRYDGTMFPYKQVLQGRVYNTGRGIKKYYFSDIEILKSRLDINDNTIVDMKWNRTNWSVEGANSMKTSLYRASRFAYFGDYLHKAERCRVNAPAVYFQEKVGVHQNEQMRRFHNRVVKRSLILKFSKPGDSLLDIGVGKGGDIPKWREARLKFVFGIDKSEDNIKNKYDGACRRYLNIKQRHADSSLQCLFLVGDCRKNLSDLLVTAAPRVLVPSKFEIISLQFCIHYFFTDSESIWGLLENINDLCKPGGYVIGTCFDGKKLFQLLEAGEIERYNRDELLLRVTKQYTHSKFPADRTSLGYEIGVFQPSINTSIPECLVHLDFLERLLGALGFSRPEQTEGLGESTGSFEVFYEGSTLTEAEKEVSFLNSYFVFQKTGDADFDLLRRLVSGKRLRL